MNRLWTTDKLSLSTDDIEDWIQKHETERLPMLSKMADYYDGKNTTILHKPKTDPDNRTPFPYGRKIVNTFTGYGYRPGYITYRSEDEQYLAMLEDIFRQNNETVKTERSGRNTATFGVSYELHYIAGMVDGLTTNIVPKFFTVDPRNMILLYDRQPEPDERFAIYYTKVADGIYNVEYYTTDSVTVYTRKNNNSGKWEYTIKSETPNFYSKVPVTPYYMNDRSIGLIEPVAPIIDDYDIIVSDSMIEFQRFANAYLRLVGMSIGDPTGDNPKLLKRILAKIKSSRTFDGLKDKDDVTFLTKDIPKDFIEYMTKLLKDQIHEQSHVPDFTSEKFSGTLSGAAVERMLFDFENIVSSAQADFDIGLYDRIKLITDLMAQIGGPVGEPLDVTINHRRNIPIDEMNAAEVAVAFRNAGISMESVVENIPREVIASVDVEMERQQAETDRAYPDIDMMRTDNADTEET